MGNELWVGGFDLHFPLVSEETVDAMFDFIKANKVSGFIFGGDQFDNSEISHHNKDKALYKPEGSFKRNEEDFDKYVLKPLEKRLGDAKKVWIIGNHDGWEQQMDERMPETRGMWGRPHNLKLVDRNWKVVEQCKSYQLGKLTVIHGDQLFNGFGSLYPTRRALDIYWRNVLFGHVHYAQSYCKISPIEDTQKIMAWSSPCLCETNPVYALNKPNAWMNGFTIIEKFQSGDFNCFPTIVTRGKFIYGGKQYGK